MKENRQALFDALDALPWDQVPIAHTATDRGHGRITTRTIQVLPAPEDLPFPHVSQVYLIERHVTDLHGNPVSAVAALGVASPAPGQVSAADLAWHVREQWAIESLHWLATPCTRKTNRRSEPGPVQESWLLCVIWRSAPCAFPGAPMSPKPPAGPVGPWTGHSPSSASHHDLETAVIREVCEMQDAETVLNVFRERGRRGLPLNELYRQLFNPSLYELAHGRIYANHGAMTPGADGETADGM